MTKNIVPVSKIMTRKLVFAHPGDDLRHVTELMKKHGVKHLPVVSGNKLVGMVSRTDILRLSFGDMFDDRSKADDTVFDLLTLDDVMNSNPITVKETDSISEVAKKFTTVEFHSLPVMKGDEVTGIISTTDLIKYLLIVIDGE